MTVWYIKQKEKSYVQVHKGFNTYHEYTYKKEFECTGNVSIETKYFNFSNLLGNFKKK